MKKVGLFFVFLLIMCITCGCMPKTSLQERAIVLAMGIDYENDNYKVTLQKFVASKESGENKTNSSDSNISVSTGKTLFDALKNAEAKDGKEIFYGHSRVYLIGRNAAKMGLKPILEFMNSNYQISLNSSVLMTAQSADEILKLNVFSESSPDISMEIIEKSGKSVDATVIETLKTANNLNGTFILPLIKGSEEKGVTIENCTVFKEAKPILTLGAEQTMGYNWILGNVSDGILVIDKPQSDGETISVNISTEKIKTKVNTDNGEVKYCVSVNSRGNISETDISGQKKMNDEYIKQVEDAVEIKIREQISDVLQEIVVNKKCDAFYIMNLIKNEDIKLYKKISEQPKEEWLPTVNFDIDVNFNITHLGVQVK